MLNFFSFYHLNIMFSSIPVEKRREVINKCYWPLLEITKRHQIPISIEASALTLEIINDLDKSWIKELNKCIEDGLCEFIGSGYSQIIGPLVPSIVNEKNIEIGQNKYSEILNYTPKIALINEQAYSVSLINHYIKNGFKAIIMEWENAYKYNSHWDKNLRYRSQIIKDNLNNEIILIWNQSTFFQQFQRYVHSDLDLNEYLFFLKKFAVDEKRYLSLYGGDAEIFNFRPGRYKSEASIIDKEWERIEQLIISIKNSNSFNFINIKELLNLDINISETNLKLESPAQPIPVKKQKKYNILRWANTGRNDININTRCHKIKEFFLSNNIEDESYWKELCYLWSSDFRTHITESRWIEFLYRLEQLEKELKINIFFDNHYKNKYSENKINSKINKNYYIDGKWLYFENENISIRFNLKKGMTLDYLINKKISPESLCGTLKHSFFDDISWMADFFTGHLVLEIPGSPKFTDLEEVQPKIKNFKNSLNLYSIIKNNLFRIEKEWIINYSGNSIELNFKIKSFYPILGSLRLGHITINPNLFDENSLKLLTKNGGSDYETFELKNQNIDLGEPVSFLVSASNAFGMTDGNVLIKDKNINLNAFVDPLKSNVICLLVHKKVDKKWFTRIIFSALEFDDTSKPAIVDIDFSMRISFSKNN